MPRYVSFRLQVWHSSRHDRLQWAARLEHLQNGQCEHFATADALFDRLRLLLDPDPPGGRDPPRGPKPTLHPGGPSDGSTNTQP
jgi:hypothetical protein